MIKKRVSFYDLAKKSVFITGGGAGIGAAITEAFLAQGSNVSFIQRSDASEFCDNMEKIIRTDLILLSVIFQMCQL